MLRPVWTPRDPEDEQTLAAAADEALWKAARAARARGVPVDLVAAYARRGRATVYRHLTDDQDQTDPR